MAAVETLDELRERLERVKSDQSTIHTENEGKRFDEVTRTRFNELEGEKRELEATIDELEKREALIARNADNGDALERATFQTARPGSTRGEDIWDLSTIERSWDHPEQEEGQFRDRALRAIERAQFPHPKARHEDTQNHLEEMVGDAEGGDRKGADVARHILMTGSPAYKVAFTKYMSGAPVSEREHALLYQVQRTMSLTAASGGYAVPYVLDPTLIPTSSGALNPYRAISSVITITVDEWRGVTHGGNAAAFQAEEAEVADDSLTLAQPTVSTEMARWFIPYSIELGMDWGSLASEMATVVQDEKDILEATKFAVGSGTNEPFGVVTGTSASVYTAADTDSVVVADLYGWQNAVPIRFRSRASVTMRNEVANIIRQLTTASGPNVWIENLTEASSAQASTFTDARMGANLFGKPVYEASGQSGAITTGQLIGVFGDFNYFKIVDRVGLTLERVDHLLGSNRRPSGQRGIFAYWRVGSKVLDAAAFRCLKLA